MKVTFYLETSREYDVDVGNDEIVGLVNVRHYETSRDKDNATVRITVKKSYWSKGIGRNLMNKAIEFFNESTLHRLELRVVKDNERAMQLYRSLGFEEEGTLRDFHKIEDKHYDVLAMLVVKK
ncbi:GNAT family N-acetyltransferase [Cellulosilyticum ruminicola]|uniref:GNAT family N-acetyltransferase n=1 Tax=Cellulosilyticum ruminicola TaxID=425254 RepID=UPI0006D1280B|nr:GNAT family protein [Cellulosilyticum ruminicola]